MSSDEGSKLLTLWGNVLGNDMKGFWGCEQCFQSAAGDSRTYAIVHLVKFHQVYLEDNIYCIFRIQKALVFYFWLL